LRLRNGDTYTNVVTNRVYKLNEDVDGSWYLSMSDEEGIHETPKTSGRVMIRALEGVYKRLFS
jgi:hypothetical protein